MVWKFFKKHKIKTWLLITLGCVITAFFCVQYSSYQAERQMKYLKKKIDEKLDISQFVKIANKVSPCVVSIVCSKEIEIGKVKFKKRMGGSGMIFSKNGYVATCAHLIEEGYEVEVVLADEKRYDAKIIGIDKDNDVACLKINRKNLPCVAFADSDDVKVGEWCLTIGTPLGYPQTVTVGNISHIKREVKSFLKLTFLQADASTNPGSSGSPLIDIYGRVIGMNNSYSTIFGGSIGIGFAIPSNVVVESLKNFMAKGKKEESKVQKMVIPQLNPMKMPWITLEKIEEKIPVFKGKKVK